MDPVITVLMTVYNGMPFLAEAIESVLEQSFDNFEFIIIDDAGNADNSVEIIESYAKKDNRIVFLCNENNMGQTASLNKGLQLAKAEFIARLDQDDVCLPFRLEQQQEYLAGHPEISIISSWEYTIDSSGRKVRSWKSRIDDYGDFLGTILLGLCPVWHPSVMFRKSDVLALGGFDVSYGPAEDYELWSRLALARKNGAFVSKFHLLQRVHGHRQSVLANEKQVESNKRAQRKALQQFVSSDRAEDILELLRFEMAANGKKLDRMYVKHLSVILEELFGAIWSGQSLTEEEFCSLKNKIFRRIGWGMRFAKSISKLPDFLFYPVFYSLSPMLLPNIRLVLSRCYHFLFKLPHSFK